VLRWQCLSCDWMLTPSDCCVSGSALAGSMLMLTVSSIPCLEEPVCGFLQASSILLSPEKGKPEATLHWGCQGRSLHEWNGAWVWSDWS